jgi:hypothetical protein
MQTFEESMDALRQIAVPGITAQQAADRLTSPEFVTALEKVYPLYQATQGEMMNDSQDYEIQVWIVREFRLRYSYDGKTHSWQITGWPDRELHKGTATTKETALNNLLDALAASVTEEAARHMMEGENDDTGRI